MNLLAFTLLSAFAPVPAPPPPVLTKEQYRADAAACANTLHQIGMIHRDFFPDGLEKVEKPPCGMRWPPPAGWSWRVAILPNAEQAGVFFALHDGSDKFEVPPTPTADELEKRPNLAWGLKNMPEWLTLPRWAKRPGQSVYRRVAVKGKPELFIIVESADLATWHKSDDDLVMTEDKLPTKMGGNFPNGFFALCGDGKVRYLTRGMTDKAVRAALLTGEGVRPIRVADRKERADDINGLDLGGR